MAAAAVQRINSQNSAAANGIQSDSATRQANISFSAPKSPVIIAYYCGYFAASDEEEEVPSRAFLKRQAQLVVDAKSRRKNLRMLPKLK